MLHTVTETYRRTDFGDTSKILSQFLRRDYSHILNDVYPERYPSSFSGRPFVPLPYLRDVAKSHAVWYRRPPLRRWDGWGGRQVPARVEQMYQTLGVNRIMRDASERMIAQSTVVGVVLPRRGERSWVLHLADPYQVQVDPDPHESRSVSAAQAIRILVPRRTSHLTVQWAWLHFTPSQIWLEDGGQKLNPYRPDPTDLSNPWAGTMSPYPIFAVRADEPEAGDFFAPLPDDLLHVQVELICAVSDAVHVGSWMSAGQPVLNNARKGAANQFRRGPEFVIPLDTDQKLEILAPQSQLEPYLHAIQRTLEYARIMQGLPDSPMKSRALTAMAKMMERVDQDAYRADLLTGLHDAEQGQYRALRQCVNWNWGAPLAGADEWPPADVHVEWAETPIPTDPLHTAQAQKMRMDSGLDSPVEVIARERQVPLEEARKIWESNLADREKIGGKAGDAV